MLDQSFAIPSLGSLHVAEVADRTHVTPATIRYYTRVGLLHPGRQPDNGYRNFSSEDVRKVLFIRKAQSLGLTISDIRAVLETVDQGEEPCAQVKRLVERRLDDVKVRIAELQATESNIIQALNLWQGSSNEADWNRSKGEQLCPLIERFESLEEQS